MKRDEAPGARRVMIKLERGGLFQAELLDGLSPRNAGLVWDLLPLDGQVRHVMYSGQAFYLKDERLRAFPENPRVMGVEPGMIGLEIPPEGVQGYVPALFFVYGWEFYFRNPYAPDGQPLYIVARIWENLEELARVGGRMIERGQERVWIERGSRG